MQKAIRGFTLIELLVVVAIIGVLSTVVMSSVNQARRKARDARRYQDLQSLRTALEMYYDDYGRYPSTAGSWQTVCTTGLNTYPYTTSGSDGWIPDLAPTYMSVLPTDPSGCVGGSFDGYIYKTNGAASEYKVMTDSTAEIGEKCGSGGPFDDPARASVAFCAVYSPGAAAY